MKASFVIRGNKPKIPLKKFQKLSKKKIRVGGTYLHIRDEGLCILCCVKLAKQVSLHTLKVINEDFLDRVDRISKGRILDKSQAAYMTQTMEIYVRKQIILDINFYTENLGADFQNDYNGQMEQFRGLDSTSERSLDDDDGESNIQEEDPVNSGKCEVEDETKTAADDKDEKKEALSDEECSCDICGRVLKKKCLKRHLLIHGEKKHKCHYEGCDDSFYRSDYLCTHMKRKHQQESKFFRKPNKKPKHSLKNFNKIQRLEKADKGAKCDICGKFMKLKRSINNHLKLHQEVKDFPCLFCPQAYVRRESLRIHIAKCHPNNSLEFE